MRLNWRPVEKLETVAHESIKTKRIDSRCVLGALIVIAEPTDVDFQVVREVRIGWLIVMVARGALECRSFVMT
jgi:hypothetical protein